MPRRRRQDEIPTLTEMLRETGYGWTVDLVQLLAWVVFLGLVGTLVYYLTTTGMSDALRQVAPHP